MPETPARAVPLRETVILGWGMAVPEEGAVYWSLGNPYRVLRARRRSTSVEEARLGDIAVDLELERLR